MDEFSGYFGMEERLKENAKSGFALLLVESLMDRRHKGLVLTCFPKQVDGFDGASVTDLPFLSYFSQNAPQLIALAYDIEFFNMIGVGSARPLNDQVSTRSLYARDKQSLVQSSGDVLAEISSVLALAVQKTDAAREMAEDDTNEARSSKKYDILHVRELMKLQARSSKKTVLRQQMKTLVDGFDNSSVRTDAFFFCPSNP